MCASQDRLLKSTSVAINIISKLLWGFSAIATIALSALILVPEVAGFVGANEHEVIVSMMKVSLTEGVIIAVLLLLILHRVRRLVDSAVSSDPFVPVNALLLRQIGWLVLAINSAQIVCDLAKLLAFTGSGVQPGFNPANIPWLGFFASLLVFVLARVFQHGSRMRADLDGTV